MSYHSFEQEKEVLSELTISENRERCTWFRHLILVLSTLLGVLIGLGNSGQYSQLCRLSLATAELLLSVGCIGFFFLLYTYSVGSARKLRESYLRELIRAQSTSDNMRPVGVKLPKFLKPCEYICYACVGIAFLLLGVYSLGVVI